MEDKSIQTKLWQFLESIDCKERTDLKASVMAVPRGYSLQLAVPGRTLNVIISMETHSYLSTDCAVISTGEVKS